MECTTTRDICELICEECLPHGTVYSFINSAVNDWAIVISHDYNMRKQLKLFFSDGLIDITCFVQRGIYETKTIHYNLADPACFDHLRDDFNSFIRKYHLIES